MQPVRQLISAGDYLDAASGIEPGEQGGHNYALLQLERGRSYFLAGDWEKSKQAFDEADKYLQWLDKKAEYRLSSGLNQAGAVVTNDNLIAYSVPSYERTMLHHYQALNYLALNQGDGALVEVRRANQVQERALKEQSGELRAARKEAAAQGVTADSAAVISAYPSMNGIVGNVKNGFQNAYTFYLSGMLYEAAGEANSAYIDYKRAVEIFPENPFLQDDVLRLAKKLGMSQELARFEKDFGKQAKAEVREQGQLIVLFEQGLVPAKQQIHLPLPIRSTDGYYGIFNVAFPAYPDWQPNKTVLSVANGKTKSKSAKIVEIESLAAKDLQEQIPTMVIRQGLRVYAKERMREKAAREGGDLGNILVNIYNTVSETADTRSWSSLPMNAQVLRLPLKVGQNKINLNLGSNGKALEIDGRAGKMELLLVTGISGKLATHHFKL